jgi:hypothetical protein
MKRILLSLAVGTAALGLAAPAHADSDANYLQTLTGDGIPVTAADSPMLVTAGHDVCTNLRGGASAQAQAGFVLRMAPQGATQKEAESLVSAAQTDLCPDAK